MDIVKNEVQKAMKTLASTLVGRPENETILAIDYEKELIVFKYGDNWVNVNCKYDSQAAMIKDFAKQFLAKFEL